MTEIKIKYLEMIQAIITRMAQNSFILKGWTITLLTALIALDISLKEKSIMMISFIPIIAFWILDSYYLSLERKYRLLYKETIESDNITFDLQLNNIHKSKKTNHFKCMFSITEFLFYIILILCLLLGYLFC